MCRTGLRFALRQMRWGLPPEAPETQHIRYAELHQYWGTMGPIAMSEYRMARLSGSRGRWSGAFVFARLPFTAAAVAPITEEPGWSGYVVLGAGEER